MNEELQSYIRTQSQNEKREKKERYARLNRFVRKGQTVFTGSSLMEQFPIEEFILDLKLPFAIYNRGVGGFTAAELRSSLEPCVFQLEPRTLLLSIGTNDLNGPDFSLEKLEAEVSSIIDEIRARLPGVRIVWLDFFPVNAAAARGPWAEETLKFRTNELIAVANERIGTMLLERGVEVLSVNDLLADADGNLKAEFTVDGIHMYANGYQAILERVMDFLFS